MKRAILFSGIAAIALTGSLALASGAGHDGYKGHKGMHGPRINFEELDANNDGKVTQEEMSAHAAARFASADTDGNGSLSVDEMKSQMATRSAERIAERADKMTARLMEKRDTNGDGELSMEEMQPKNQGKMFSRLDKDGDGAISAEEFAAMKGKHNRGKRHDTE